MTETRIPQIYPWQQALRDTLVQRCASGKLAHAYVLGGPKGIGKSGFAAAFAAFLLCRSPVDGTACGHCSSCGLVAAGSHPDLIRTAPESGSRIIKIEQIRQLGRFAQHTSHAGTRVIILSPAEGLATASANALLKLLEEPPASTYFLLLSHQPGLLMPTIRSRCQPLPMPEPDAAMAMQWLQQQSPQNSPEELQEAITLSHGRPLEALQALQQGLPQVRRTLLSGLTGVLKRRVLPIDLARTYEKANSVDALLLMESCLGSLIRFQASGAQHFLSSPELRELVSAAAIDPAAGRTQGRSLLTLYALVRQALAQLSSAANPNPALILENCFIAWQQALNKNP